MMTRFAFLILLLVTSCTVKAQLISRIYTSSLQEFFPAAKFSNAGIINHAHTPISTLPFITSKIKYTAFFCQLENRVDKKLNLRLKLRAGNDDMYRKINTQLK